MAEVITTATSDRSARKRGKFVPAEDLIIIREVAALGAHVASYGKVRQTFEKVAVGVNRNPHMSEKVSWKSVQDRYKRLQDDFDQEDARNGVLSGVAGGEMGELYQMLSQMRQERDSFVNEKGAVRSEKARREEEKERMGREVVKMALLRKTKRSSEEEDIEGSPGVEEDLSNGSESLGSGRKRRKIGRGRRLEVSSGLMAFSERLKEAKLARVALDREALNFEKEKFAQSIAEREKDRVERRAEREDAQNVELEKFKLMMDVMRGKSKMAFVFLQLMYSLFLRNDVIYSLFNWNSLPSR